MNRIDRLNALLIHLQGKPRVTIDELEERFTIGRRTVFRDIKSLLEAGVPIGGNAGEGYFVVEGYHLPPVVFSKEEASAILLGAKFIEQNADQQTVETFEKAMYKIKAVLKYSDKEFLDNLESRILVRPNPNPSQFPDSHISELQSSIASNRVIDIVYYSQYNDSTTQRQVEPLGMVYYSSRWHLIGFCRLRQDLRDFRTDRIQKLETTRESFDPKSHPDYMDFLNRTLIGTDAKEAVINCSRTAARFMGEQKYFQGLIEESSIGPDRIQMKFVVPYYEYFARWLLMYGNEIEIVKSEELMDITARLIRELMDHHNILVD